VLLRRGHGYGTHWNVTLISIMKSQEQGTK